MAEFLETVEDWQAGRSLIECNKFMLQHGINTDVTFVLGQKKIPVKAHKYVLISRSSVFQSIFCGTISSKEGSDVIPVSDIDADNFKSLLMYLYCENADITSRNVGNLLYAAKKYAVTGLVEKCLDFLESSLSTDNVCDILEKVHLYDGKKLETRCLTFIMENGVTVLKSEDFTNLCADCLGQIIKSDELVVDEVIIYQALLRWAEKECSRRTIQVTDANIRTVLGPTLFHVRFPLINAVYFTNQISSREILNPQEIIAVYQYYHGRQQANNRKFKTKRRRGFSLFSAIRFNLILMEEFECKGKVHSISFSASQPIILHGIVVYGCWEGSFVYHIKIEITEEKTIRQSNTVPLKDNQAEQFGMEKVKFALKDANPKDSTLKELKTLSTASLLDKNSKESVCSGHPKNTMERNVNVTFVSIATEKTIHTYDVMLAKPVEVYPGKVYSCHLEMDGPPTKLGFHGKNEISSEGVTFSFYQSEGSRTHVEKGQIPGLLFTLPKPQVK